jgi:DNA-binding response OmpR family regulator
LPDASRRILVVEDEPLIRQLLIAVLSLKNYQVETCADGEEGLERIRAGGIDLLITDFRMPRKTGVELIQGLRELRLSLPTILMSSNTPDEMMLTAGDLDGVEFLRKPFGIQEIHACIVRALK